ncbi:hypothetical protein CCMA1212_006844 [Trichoderma ghanense]|uniref:Uncharacterized protein n=1 Tax=Trichoderma ghanense TaxID=65468 RepID=A0ABY2H1A3_9HYPO
MTTYKHRLTSRLNSNILGIRESRGSRNIGLLVHIECNRRRNYTPATKMPESLEPEPWWLDYALIDDEPGNVDGQLDHSFETTATMWRKLCYTRNISANPWCRCLLFGERMTNSLFLLAQRRISEACLMLRFISLTLVIFAVVSNTQGTLHYILPFSQRTFFGWGWNSNSRNDVIPHVRVEKLPGYGNRWR